MTGQGKGPNSVEGSPRGYGLTGVLWAIEHPLTTAGLICTPGLAVIYGSLFPISFFTGLGLLVGPFLFVALAVIVWVLKSRSYDTSRPTQAVSEWVDYKKSALKSYKGKSKIPMETFIEAYIHEEIGLKEDLFEVLQHRYELLNFSFTNNHIKGFLKDILDKARKHDAAADQIDVADVYNKGNDFYGWFLGKPMLYSTAIFRNRDETLDVAQDRKLHLICKMAHMKRGMTHLDLGCGWGTLVSHAAKHYGVTSTGITLSKEQAKFCEERIKEYGVVDNVKIKIMNAWDLPETQYDRITCLEMSEHIGIRDYQKFMHHVRNRLKDDGIFYLQIAGLRRAWQYEDLVWGLFMGKYIFPGADASCPLGWVANQVERAGFEIHRVENTGVHYAITIYRWYQNWVENKDVVVAAYAMGPPGPDGKPLKGHPEYWWRLWAVFLAWSAIIAFQGTSTVFMITLMKNTRSDKTSMKCSEDYAGPKPAMDRSAFKIDPGFDPENVIGMQC